eukprot:5777809-Heterocapsa_arctica.AAC.1
MLQGPCAPCCVATWLRSALPGIGPSATLAARIAGWRRRIVSTGIGVARPGRRRARRHWGSLGPARRCVADSRTGLPGQ